MVTFARRAGGLRWACLSQPTWPPMRLELGSRAAAAPRCRGGGVHVGRADSTLLVARAEAGVGAAAAPRSMETWRGAGLLTAEARRRSKRGWTEARTARARPRAQAFGCPRACASVHCLDAGSWPRPAHGQTRHWAALPPAPTHIPHPLATPHRCARHFASLPFEIQEIYGGASGPWAPSGFRYSTRCCAPNGP